jgi:hypothetical protein
MQYLPIGVWKGADILRDMELRVVLEATIAHGSGNTPR